MVDDTKEKNLPVQNNKPVIKNYQDISIFLFLFKMIQVIFTLVNIKIMQIREKKFEPITIEEKKIKALDIVGKLVSFFNGEGDINYEKFINERDKFLKQIGEAHLIEHLNDPKFIENMSSKTISLTNEENEPILDFFHVMEIPAFRLKELSDIYQNFQEEPTQELLNKLSAIYKDLNVKVMGADKDSDARLTKLQQLMTLVRITDHDYIEFAKNKLGSMLDNLRDICNEAPGVMELKNYEGPQGDKATRF